MLFIFTYVAITLYSGAFQLSSVNDITYLCSVRNPNAVRHWFGLFPVRSPLLRKSMFLSLPSGT